MISCEIGTGTSYVNLAGETGLVVPPSDSVAFGQALEVFWTQPEQVAVWGRGALKRYEENFKAETMAKRYMGAYGEVLTGHWNLNARSKRGPIKAKR
jgi:rhamnosyl/mannosyltransferase